MKKVILVPFVALVVAMGVASCNRKVARISEDKVKDLSGRWNSTDSKLTAEKMIKDCYSSPNNWITNYKSEKGKKPSVIVGVIKNKSHEHIDAEIFATDLEQSFITTGEVVLIQGGEKRNEIRGERGDQQDNASQSTMKAFGLEKGADYMLQGDINSIVDSYKRKKVVMYEVSLQLTDIQTNQVVWIGTKKIYKAIKN